MIFISYFCDFGKLGTAYVETDPEEADLHTTICRLRDGQYVNPKRIIRVNIAAGTAEDVTDEFYLSYVDLPISQDSSLDWRMRIGQANGEIRLHNMD